MAQHHNTGLLVDVDIESPGSSSVSREGEKTKSDKILTLTGGEDEAICSKTRNIYDAIDSISTDHSDGGGRQRERINSVDSTSSIRSYDSTGGNTTLTTT